MILIGLGAVGSHVADALIRTGRKVWLVDPDRVEEENLPQTSYLPGDVGRFKVDVLCERYALARESCLAKPAEKVIRMLPREPLVLMTDSLESRMRILRLVEPDRDVWHLAISLRQGVIMHAPAKRLLDVFGGKKGFACQSRRLPPALPRLTAAVFLHALSILQEGEALSILLTEDGVRIDSYRLG